MYADEARPPVRARQLLHSNAECQEIVGQSEKKHQFLLPSISAGKKRRHRRRIWLEINLNPDEVRKSWNYPQGFSLRSCLAPGFRVATVMENNSSHLLIFPYLLAVGGRNRDPETRKPLHSRGGGNGILAITLRWGVIHFSPTTKNSGQTINFTL